MKESRCGPAETVSLLLARDNGIGKSAAGDATKISLAV